MPKPRRARFPSMWGYSSSGDEDEAVEYRVPWSGCPHITNTSPDPGDMSRNKVMADYIENLWTETREDGTSSKNVPLLFHEEHTLYTLIQANPAKNFNLLINKSVSKPSLLKALGDKLHGESVLKLCDLVNKRKNIQSLFLEYFFRHFFPAYMKRKYSWLTIDLLLRANSAHPAAFKILLHAIINDTDIPSKITQDLVQNMNLRGRQTFLAKILDLELTPEQFTYHLPAIYLAYKECDKTDRIQTYVQLNLAHHAKHCEVDTNYGRLLHLHVFTLNPEQVNVAPVESLMEKHKSPYKRACQSMWAEKMIQSSSYVYFVRQPPNPGNRHM